MPANLPPDYHEAEKRWRAAKTAAEKIAALEEMLRIMPKHKGTDKLQADLKARIAKLKKEPPKKGARRGFSPMIPKEGAGQVALVGPPNSGKSSLVARLTKAKPEVAAYPHTTLKPTPGMMPFEDIAFQLIDLPPLSEDYTEPWLFDLIKRADLVWAVVDGTSPLTQFEKIEALLTVKRIQLIPVGQELPEDLLAGWTYLEAVVVATGSDKAETAENLLILDELMEGRWPIWAVSTVTNQGLEELKRATFGALDIIRVYTKLPGKPPDMGAPFTLARGATVADLAAKIHKDFSDKLRHARVWGSGVFDGQTVPREHILSEGDVVEIHA